ncbi:hypothetical protein DICPUDRAFT_149391 [Dictyostelium purpureum]|uniref:Methylosome subunit pICln n=1 Tax=Dictyostelium purpureum TaxID=5786 RepID=F0ZDK9_DICPU|nr:uncharacterized protein DICPUDRAFT_149391 [Dictyostelium purpureum]EGC37932.1 hypothetical protein DICPUDRAFT_149391 [Dictyostelium purpureum]|eukprot:XP_003285503.1 hypothetical protein DICPUDRAFT_149391 [Dictyostelium purpureum]
MVEINSLLIAEEQVFFELDSVTLYISFNNIGPGHLYVTNKNIRWISQDKQRNYNFNFYLIGLNAIFNANEDFPNCIYCQFDEIINPTIENGNGNSNGNDSNSDENEEDETYTEIRFIPLDESKIRDIYDAFCQGALLNPDEDQDDEGDFYFNEEENDEQELAFDPNDLERFEDAEE